MFNRVKNKIPRDIKYIIKYPANSFNAFLQSICIMVRPITRLNTLKSDHPQIIVSLTSYPSRFNKLYFTIKSIFVQTVKPDKIILYLGNDSIGKKLPYRLKMLRKYGLEIVYKEENIYSYKKIVYSVREYPDDIIITIDDDLLYERNMIKLLLDSYKEHPDCVSAKRTHGMTSFDGKKIKKYKDWIYECTSELMPSHSLMATTGAGTLFPPGVLVKEDFENNEFIKYCRTADDIWIKFCLLKRNIPVVFVAGKRVMPLEQLGTQEFALNTENVVNSKNDEYISILQDYFSINLADYAFRS